MKPIRTWVLVADGKRARILENLGPGKGLKSVEGLEFSNALPSGDEGANERGRTFESATPARSSLEPPTDPERLSKRRFAADLGRAVRTKLEDGAYDRLVLVAPAQMLGELRAEIDEHVRKVVTGDLSADLTHMKDDEVARHLGAVFAV